MTAIWAPLAGDGGDGLAFKDDVEQSSLDGAERAEHRAAGALQRAGAEFDLLSGRSAGGDPVVSGDNLGGEPGAAAADGAQRGADLLHCADHLCRLRAVDLQALRDYAAGL